MPDKTWFSNFDLWFVTQEARRKYSFRLFGFQNKQLFPPSCRLMQLVGARLCIRQCLLAWARFVCLFVYTHRPRPLRTSGKIVHYVEGLWEVQPRSPVGQVRWLVVLRSIFQCVQMWFHMLRRGMGQAPTLWREGCRIGPVWRYRIPLTSA